MQFDNPSVHPDAQFVEIATVRSLVTASGHGFFSKDAMRGSRASNCAMLLHGVYYFVISRTIGSTRSYDAYEWSNGAMSYVTPWTPWATSKEAWQAIDAAIAQSHV